MQITPSPTAAPEGSTEVSITRRSVLAFFALAYGLSWALWLVPLLGAEEPVATIAEVAALFGPTAAAAIVSWRVGWLREWVAGILRWRAAVRWWTIALGLPLAYFVTVHVGLLLGGYDAVDFSLFPVRAISYLPTLILMTLAMGGANEEPGWRGFALPHLQQRFSPMRATLVLGSAWALWHLPSLLLVAQAGHGLGARGMGLVVAGSAVEILAWAFVFTWLYNHTKSTLLCIFLHGGINAASASLLVSAAALQGSAYLQVALTSNAVVILGVMALVTLTRGQLGPR